MICIRKCRQCGKQFDAEFGSGTLLCERCAGGAPESFFEDDFERYKKPPINRRPKILQGANSFDEEISILDSVARRENRKTSEDAALAAAMKKLLEQLK